MTRKFKVVDWTHSHEWLVEITGKDGSYTPILELHRTGDGTKPTYANQLYQAAKLLETDGIEALNNPHAMIGKTCGCGECFTCAAAAIIEKVSA